MNYDRIYEYRFRTVDRADKIATWKILARWIARQMGDPQIVLDPAAGACEFVNGVPARERWAVDMGSQVTQLAEPGVRAIAGRIDQVELPREHFEGIFVSNFLEHLPTQESVAEFLERMHACLVPGGVIAVMGPNFRACPREYFDFADHTLILTDRSLTEHLHAAGFDVERVVPRFLPLTYRGRLPAKGFLVEAFLRLPIAWPIVGRQFFAIARKPRVSPVARPRLS